MEPVDIQAVELKLSDVTVTAIPMNVQQSTHKSNNLSATSVSSTLSALSNKASVVANGISDLSLPATIVPVSNNGATKDNVSKYVQLLLAIEEMGREVRPTYAGSRSSAERLKRGIIQARVLVRECLLETERSARQ